MSENMIKKETKFFMLPDYEEEEQYLSEMHQNGWKLKKVGVYRYTFEKCEPENVVYRLDFNTSTKNEDNYLRMFEDYGWEYIQDFNNFSYFRKSADGVSDDELEIFSDNESRLEMIHKIIATKLFPLWIIFLLLIIPNIHRAVSGDFVDPVLNTIFAVLYIVLFAVYTYIFIRCYTGFKRLKNKYSKK